MQLSFLFLKKHFRKHHIMGFPVQANNKQQQQHQQHQQQVIIHHHHHHLNSQKFLFYLKVI